MRSPEKTGGTGKGAVPGWGRFVRNVASNWALFFFNAAIGFFLSPFVVHHLGNAEYGTWTLLGSLTGYLGLMDLGVRGAVTRYVARFLAAGEPEQAQRHVWVAMRLFLMIGVLVLAGASVLSIVVDAVFHLPPPLVAKARIVLVLTGSAMAVTLVTGVFGGIVVGRERFDLLNVTEVTIEVLRVVGVVAVLSAGLGIVALAVIQLGVALARGAVQFGLARHLAPDLYPRLTYWRRQEAGRLLGFGVSSTLIRVSFMLAFYTDSIVISTALPVALVTYFAIGATLVQYGRVLVGGLSAVMTPRASALEGAGSHQELRETYLSVGRLAGAVLLPVVATFLIRGETFISLWMGPQYAETSGAILRVLSLPLLFTAGRQVSATTLQGVNRHHGLVPVYLLEGAVNLGISLLLVRTLGLIGVAWGTAIPALVVSLVFVPWYARRHLQVTVWSQVWGFWIRPLVAVAPFACLSWVLERVWPVHTLPGFAGQVALALPTALLGVAIFSLSVSERARLKTWATRITSFVTTPAA